MQLASQSRVTGLDESNRRLWRIATAITARVPRYAAVRNSLP